MTHCLYTDLTKKLDFFFVFRNSIPIFENSVGPDQMASGSKVFHQRAINPQLYFANICIILKVCRIIYNMYRLFLESVYWL